MVQPTPFLTISPVTPSINPAPARIRSYSSSPSCAETPINPPLSETECAINASPQRARNSGGGLIPERQAWPSWVAFGDLEWRVRANVLHTARLMDGCDWRACVRAAGRVSASATPGFSAGPRVTARSAALMPSKSSSDDAHGQAAFIKITDSACAMLTRGGTYFILISRGAEREAWRFTYFL